MFQIKVVEPYVSYKKVSGCMCLSPSQSGAGGLQRLIFFKYYNVPKLERRFTSGLNAAKNTDYIEKWFKEKLF